ncbi:MAG: deaminase [Arachnia propionica]|uniref:nucleoside deaminase n=1 Tax=Arachnia propionica TaxID=1750 RepID=UPI0026FFFEF5|nr:deaminase [Arachnia propionica]
MSSFLETMMSRAVAHAVQHVSRGGLPFVGLVVRDGQVLSGFGVNRVLETSDPMAHAEIVALREAVASHGQGGLIGATLLATGEPCGMCCHHAIAQGIRDVRVAIDRDVAAEHGFDYRPSYPAFNIGDDLRAAIMHPLRVPGDLLPFTLFLNHRAQKV